MLVDLLIRNARFADGRRRQDVTIADGIATISPAIIICADGDRLAVARRRGASPSGAAE
jgi:hypothetical protein